MPDQILCPDCGHDIDDHSWDGCQLEPPSACLLSAMDIAHAYGEQRWKDGLEYGWLAHELRQGFIASEMRKDIESD